MNHSKERITPSAVRVEDLASASECTGLTPAAVQTPEEGENYAELYAIHTQKPAWKAEKAGCPAPKEKDS